jgi:hypothetical protein
MLLPFLFAAAPDEPLSPPTPRAPEIEPPAEPPTAPDAEPPTAPDPHVVPPGVPFREPEPEPDVPDGPGISDPDLAPGAPLSPPAPAPAPPPDPAAPPGALHGGYTAFATGSPLPTDRMAGDDADEEGDVPYDIASLPPDHPAYDRVQNRPRTPPRRRWRLSGLLAAAALVAAGLFITYVLFRPVPGPGEVPDLLTVAAAHADAVVLDLETSDLDEAEEYIIGEFGWPIRVPVLPEARLEGAGVEALAEGVEVPVLRYRTEAGAPITVYAYDYAFLDAAADRLTLAAPVYARLAADPPVDVRRVGEAYLVLWRRRAAIYTAVMTDDPAPLVEYLSRR